jgi:hypothetical protein
VGASVVLYGSWIGLCGSERLGKAAAQGAPRYPKVRFGVKQASDILQAKTALYGPFERLPQFLSLAATGQG